MGEDKSKNQLISACNKAFKTDSQRLAFSVQIGFVFTAQWFKLGGGVAHYLTRR